jgi:hypothetical protein
MRQTLSPPINACKILVSEDLLSYMASRFIFYLHN